MQVAFREPAEAERSAKIDVVISWNCAHNIQSLLAIDRGRAQTVPLFNYRWWDIWTFTIWTARGFVVSWGFRRLI